MRAPLATLLLFLASPAAAATAPSVGAEAYESDCASCHTLDGHSTVSGPSLKGVVWRRVASLTDFAYSAGLRQTIGNWTPGRLDAYLRNTQGFAPGTSMFFVIADKTQRRAIISYLETVK